MAKTIFVNLPVADVSRATAFYQALGFIKDTRFSNEFASAMTWSDTISFMLLGHDYFRTFTTRAIADSHAATGALYALSFDSREEVDAIATRAGEAGGTADVREKQDMGFLYSRSFADPDGNIFEPMWMDMAGFEAAQQAGTPAA